jgi:DNA-binding transcriptional MerR regulator
MTSDDLYEGIPLTIQQVSMITGIHKATLRYWEKLFGAYVQPTRTHGNHRLYSSDHIHRILELKRLLKVEGYTVSGVRRRLNLTDSPSQN